MPPKRNNKRPASAMAESTTAHSNVASGEDNSILENGERKAMDPPSKRTRASSSAKTAANGKLEASYLVPQSSAVLSVEDVRF